MNDLTHRLNENLQAVKESFEQLSRAQPLLPEPDVVRDEALKLRLASIQLQHLAQDLSYHLIHKKSQVDHKMAAANDQN